MRSTIGAAGRAPLKSSDDMGGPPAARIQYPAAGETPSNRARTRTIRSVHLPTAMVPDALISSG